VCSALEAAGFPCWIAPRNVLPGTMYAGGIVHAIDESSILVLILSKDAVASAHVGRVDWIGCADEACKEAINGSHSCLRQVKASRPAERPMSPSIGACREHESHCWRDCLATVSRSYGLRHASDSLPPGGSVLAHQEGLS
jgi:hypothetical protein